MDTPNTPAYEPTIVQLPFPGDLEGFTYASARERANALIGAAEAIFESATASGQTIVIDEPDRVVSRDVFAGALPVSEVTRTAEAIHLSALLNAYDVTVVQSAQQLRNFCTNILIDRAASAPKDSDRLRAVEMIGKIKDVALFEERSTVLVAQMSTDQIKTALQDKLASLRQRAAQAQAAEVVDAVLTTPKET